MTNAKSKTQPGTVTLEEINPRVATTMLIHGLLSPEDAKTFKPANVTVDALVRMLQRTNEVRNRPILLPDVLKYARDMENGEWLWTGAPIQIDTEGYVRDGQHRLLAIIRSKTTHKMLVVRDVDPKAQLVMDIGRPRTAAQQMHLRGVRNSTQVTAAASLLLRWRSGKILSTFKPSIPELDHVIAEEPELADGCNWGVRFRMLLRRSPVSTFSAAYVEAGHIDSTARDKFFGQLLSGEDLVLHHPILTLRNTIIRNRTTDVRFRQAGQLYQIVRAWNNWRKDEPAQMLRVPATLTSETFPKML